MSHNNIKINSSSKPDASGNISMSASDLSNVDLENASDGQIVKYNQSTNSWEAANQTSGSIQHIWIGGKQNDYSNSPSTSLSSNSIVYIWDDNPVNTITGAVINVTSGNANSNENDWVQNIELPIGKYIFRCQTQFDFSSSGYATYRIATYVNTTNVTSYGVVGDLRTSTFGPSNSTGIGMYNVTSNNTQFRFYMGASSGLNSVANQGNKPSEFGLIYIEKVS